MEASDDLVEIVNRSQTFFESKKLLCSKIPYFEKMFNCDLLESKENKVTLDLDELGFNNVLTFVHSDMFVISKGNVLQTYDCCDYLMIETLQKECFDYFHQNFTTDDIPMVLETINECSKLITPRIINCFICRHFLKISNTGAFYNFSFETMEYILKLDLMIDSEYQVFDAIKRWILFDKDGGRNEHLIKLMKLIRWSHVEENDLAKIKDDSLVTNQQGLDAVLGSTSSGCELNYTTNRVTVNQPLVINKIDESTVGISILGPNSLISCGKFSLNESLPTNLITDEHITDIIYDSGRKGIRVDWKLRMCKYLKMIGSDDSYYDQMYKFFVFKNISQLNWFITTEIYDKDTLRRPPVDGLLDSGVFIGFSFVRETISNDGFRYRCECVYLNSSINLKEKFVLRFANNSVHVCRIQEKNFVLNRNLEIFTVDLSTKTSQRSTLSNDHGFGFEDVELTNYHNELLLIQKSKLKIFTFNQLDQNCSLKCQIKIPGQLIAISSICLSSNDIKMIYSKK